MLNPSQKLCDAVTETLDKKPELDLVPKLEDKQPAEEIEIEDNLHVKLEESADDGSDFDPNLCPEDQDNFFEDYSSDNEPLSSLKRKRKPEISEAKNDQPLVKSKKSANKGENQSVGEAKCPICDKTFIHKHALKIHTKAEHSEGEHKCEVCGSTYHKKRFLLRHMVSHKADGGCLKCGIVTKMTPSEWDDHETRFHLGRLAKPLVS